MGKKTKDCAIVDCSVFCVDTEKMLSDKPYTSRSIADIKKFKLSVKDQVDNHGWVVYKDTLAFWESQPEEVRKHARPLKTDLPIKDFTSQFIDYLISCRKIDYWWSRSNSFDPILLWRLFEAVGKEDSIHEYLKHWRIRDTRTFIDAKLDFPKVNGFIPIADEEFWDKIFQEHNSSWDVLADVLRMQAILRAENDLEMIER